MSPIPRPLLAAAALLAAAGGLTHAWAVGWEESGEASWYGARQAGRRTSSGERFDPRAMTAAHTTLPLGSRVRVTMQDTGESIVVRITDRLPPHGLRVIDLSQGAAARLGMVSRGTAWVSLTPAMPGEVDEVAEASGDLEAAPATPRRRGPPRMHHAGR